MSQAINHFHRFGEFTVDGDQKVLLRNDSPLPLAPKVFDTLLILLDNRGRIVEKEDLMRRLWPDTFVEESNLTFNIQQLRKSLSDDARNPRYVGTVQRRGYRFIADVEEVLSDRSQAAVQSARPFETSDALSADAGNRLINQIDAQESEPDIKSANENPASTLEKHFAVTPAADTPSIN